jgi:hypothetical protein
VAQIAAMEAGALLALTRHLRPRIVQLDAAELRELVQRLRERLGPASAEG